VCVDFYVCAFEGVCVTVCVVGYLCVCLCGWLYVCG